MLNNDKGNVVPSEQAGFTEILSVAIISSLIIATAVVTSLLYELPLSVHARSNNVAAAIPFLPPSSNYSTASSQKSTPTTNDTSLQSTSTHQRSNEGTLTIKQVILGTEKLLPNSKFKITPNPFTLKGSLTIYDNNATLDFDPGSGVIVLRNVKFSPYLINETSSPGFGPVLLKTRITLHNTDPNPIVSIENRQLNSPFTGSAIVTAPYLNDSSLRTFISNGATVGRTPISKVDQLPSGLLVSSEKQTINSTINASLSLKPITFKTSVPATTSASQIYKLFKIPTYPAPVKDIASHVIYVSPVFVIEQQGSGNNTFILTPVIAKIFPGMTVMLNHNSSVGSGLAKVENIKMKFAESANNIGFSFGISDNIPTSFRLPRVPVDTVALFINVGYIGVGGGVTSAIKVVNFSNPKSFASSPDISMLVSKSSHLSISKLPDGCPDIRLYSFNESIAKWQQLDKPIRTTMLDVHDECGYILQTQHFSKFAVGGILEQ